MIDPLEGFPVRPASHTVLGTKSDVPHVIAIACAGASSTCDRHGVSVVLSIKHHIAFR